MPLAGEILTASVLSIGIVATPISTGSIGTATSGTTETFDTVLGYYQPTLINGHRYMVCLNGLVGNGAAGDVYTIQIRDSGNSSNPTTSSTLLTVAEWACITAGTSGRQSIPVQGSFVASGSGVHTLGVSATRLSGAGSFTPISAPSGARELLVWDMGGN